MGVVPHCLRFVKVILIGLGLPPCQVTRAVTSAICKEKRNLGIALCLYIAVLPPADNIKYMLRKSQDFILRSRGPQHPILGTRLTSNNWVSYTVAIIFQVRSHGVPATQSTHPAPTNIAPTFHDESPVDTN